MAYDKIIVDREHEGQVLRLLLNAPKGNVLDKQMMSEINEAFLTDAGESSVKAIVFEGVGDHFSFGASVEEHQKELVAEMLATFHGLTRTLIRTSKPMFALVRGQCLGGGLELAAFCQWIFASTNAMFGQPEIKLGVFPPVASLVLPYRIGQSAADDLILTGRSITADEAKQLGLVHSVSEDPGRQIVDFIAKHILPKSSASLQFTVRSARFEMHDAFLRNIDALEKLYVAELMETDDANEGIVSFVEKRRPIWTNR